MNSHFRILVFAIAAYIGSPVVSASTIDFSTAGTNLFGDAAGDAVNDPVVTQDGIIMSVELYSFASFIDFNEARIDGLHADIFPTDALELDSISVLFDFSGVGFQVGQVTFEFAQLGPGINFAVNGGNIFEFDSIFELPQDPTAISPGVLAIVEPGLVTLNGPVDSFLVGGQELLIDNIVATPVPEPTTICLLCAGVIVLLRQRYHSNTSV